ncbi:MAG: hypothetical protein MASP_01028 [Candidatus Methanolliviera sp. GoM_asphalt]|nr:MAG: hypothetical protein MASP_01028 [Candidatus Methanolliviera sp. GoM_asphalt]
MGQISIMFEEMLAVVPAMMEACGMGGLAGGGKA